MMRSIGVIFKEEEKPKIDPTKFINSFSETVVEEVKPKLKLPTLIFNEKTVELAPREEVKPETEVSEAKNDVHKENTPESIANPSSPIRSNRSCQRIQ